MKRIHHRLSSGASRNLVKHRFVTVEGVRTFYREAGSTDKTLKLYEGHYHDLLNDLGREQVMADIVDWIDARLPVREEAQTTGPPVTA